jgi:hypothetical protein
MPINTANRKMSTKIATQMTWLFNF